jgi:hypothetical protein
MKNAGRARTQKRYSKKQDAGTGASSVPKGQNRAHYDNKDQQHFAELEKIVQGAGYSLQDIVRHFPAFIRRRDVPRFIAHYELFKLIQDMPGSIAELGIFRGSGFFTWTNFLESFCPSDRTRKVYGFDHFKGLVQHNKKTDGNLTPWLQRVVGELVSEKETMEALIKLHNDDNLLPGVERCLLVDGDIKKTLPKFVKQHPGLRLSLLYFDIGLYDPTLAGLKYLYPLVMPGGLVVFNGYGMEPWAGEAAAIEEYFGKKNLQPVMRKFDFSTLPHAYFIKP